MIATLSVVFNFVIQGHHSYIMYKVIMDVDIDKQLGQARIWKNHDTFAVAIIILGQWTILMLSNE